MADLTTISEIEKAINNLGTKTLISALREHGVKGASKHIRRELIYCYHEKVINISISNFIKRLKKDEVKKAFGILDLETAKGESDDDVSYLNSIN